MSLRNKCGETIKLTSETSRTLPDHQLLFKFLLTHLLSHRTVLRRSFRTILHDDILRWRIMSKRHTAFDVQVTDLDELESRYDEVSCRHGLDCVVDVDAGKTEFEERD